MNKKQFLMSFFGIFFLALVFAAVKVPESKACGVECNGDDSNNCTYDDSFWDSFGSDNKLCVVGKSITPGGGTNTASGMESCSSGSGSTAKACRVNTCPSSLDLSGNVNGLQCDIGTTNTALGCSDPLSNTPPGPLSGIWDQSRSQCIICNSSGKVDKVCGNDSGIYTDVSNNCTGSSGSGTFETACNGYVGVSNTISSQCDDRSQGCVGTQGFCDANGQWNQCAENNCAAPGVCPAPSGLTINVSASQNPVGVSNTSTVTFTVRKTSDSSVVSGAAVTIISINCGTLPNPGSATNAAGQTTSVFTAPGSAGICTASVKAALAGYADGTANYPITVTVCIGSNYADYNDYRYGKGQSIMLEGLNPDGSDNFALCIYNPSNGLEKSDSFISSFPRNTNFVANVTGIWKGLAVAGFGGCPGSFDANQGCAASTEVVECESDTDCTAPAVCSLSTYTCVGGGGGGGSVSAPFCESALVPADIGKSCGTRIVTAADVAAGGYCCSAEATSWVFLTQEDCQNSDPACAAGGGGAVEDCVAIGDEDNNGFEDCADPACLDGTACAGGGTCSGGECVVGPPPPPSCSGPGMYRSPLSYCSIVELIAAATNWILGLVSSVIILILIVGGIMYVTSAGDEERIRTAKNIILYAVVGLAIILLAYSLIIEVQSILGIT